MTAQQGVTFPGVGGPEGSAAWLAVIDMRDEGGRKLAAVAQWITQWDGVSPPPERADE